MNQYVLHLDSHYYVKRDKHGMVMLTAKVEAAQIFDDQLSATLFSRSLPGAWQVQVF